MSAEPSLLSFFPFPETRDSGMLSKSDIQCFLQCPRKLWLVHNKPDLIPRDDPTLYRRATDGNIVGNKARERLGLDYLWPPTREDKIAAAEKAKTLLAALKGSDPLISLLIY